MADQIERRDFLLSMVLLPVGAAVAGCGEDAKEDPPQDAAPECDGVGAESTAVIGHTHKICVPRPTLEKPPGDGAEITTIQEAREHTHTITLTAKQLTMLHEQTGQVTVTTSSWSDHNHQFTLGVIPIPDMG